MNDQISSLEIRKKILALTQEFIEAKQKEGFQKIIPGKDYIPVTAKFVDQNEIKNLIDSSLDLWWTGDKYQKQFEQKFSEFHGYQHKSVFVNSGSSANLLAFAALRELGVKSGDEVITASLGFPTTLNPILQNACTPVFVDVDLKTLNPTLESIKSAYTKKTKVVMISHTLGNPCEIQEISDWCKREKLFLIEDCCDALGSTYNNKTVGTFGDFSTFSFYPAHQITTGEGGAILSKLPEYVKILNSLRDWGRDCWCPTGKDNTCGKRFDWNFDGMPKGYDHKYIYSRIGYNLKATEMQAALGCSQLLKLNAFISQRKSTWRYLYEKITSNEDLLKYFEPIEPTKGSDPAWFGFAIMCRSGVDKNKVVQYLENNKIGTRPVFGGNLLRQPAYQSQNFNYKNQFSNTDQIFKSVFWIGVHPLLNKGHLDYVLDCLIRYIQL